MAARRDTTCGARFRRAVPLTQPDPVAEDDDVVLTPLGAAFLAALSQDDRFRDIVADPFGQHHPRSG